MAVLELESPYKEVWRKAYIRESEDGRKRVDLINDATNRTTVSYARYLLAVKIGRFLTEDEEADHIDTDKSNDKIENLQVLTVKEHLKKTVSEIPKGVCNTVLCSHCSKSINIPTWKLNVRKNFFCSRSCNAKFSRSKGLWSGKQSFSDDLINEIRRLYKEGKTGYRISKILNLSSGSVYTYLKNFKD